MGLEACPLCGGAFEERPAEVWTDFRLRQCAACGLQAWDPPLAGSAEWYESSAHYLTSPFASWLGWNHERALAELGGATQTVLDIGCGDGRFVYAAAARGIDASGIDHSERLVRLGNERHAGSRLSRTSIEEFQAARRTFDAVTLFEVIEHVPHPLELLRTAAAVVRPGGSVIVSTPNRLGYPWGRHPMDRPPHHLTRWTPQTLRTALERVGLHDVRILLSPGRIGVRSYLMDRIRFGLVSRALRAENAPLGKASPAARPGIRLAIVAKDRVLRIVATLLAPFVGRRYAGGAMIAIARRSAP